MKSFLPLVALVAVSFFTGACEKQPYAETRVFTHHGEHAAEAGKDHAKGEAGTPAEPSAEPKH